MSVSFHVVFNPDELWPTKLHHWPICSSFDQSQLSRWSLQLIYCITVSLHSKCILLTVTTLGSLNVSGEDLWTKQISADKISTPPQLLSTSSSSSCTSLLHTPFLFSHPGLTYLPLFLNASCCFESCEWKVCRSGPGQDIYNSQSGQMQAL